MVKLGKLPPRFHPKTLLLILLFATAAFAQQEPDSQSIEDMLNNANLSLRLMTVGIQYEICERDFHPFWHRIYWQESDGLHYLPFPEPWETLVRLFSHDPCKAAMRQGGACDWDLGKDWDKAKKILGCKVKEDANV